LSVAPGLRVAIAQTPFQAELGGSRVHSPEGVQMLRLPMQAAGVASFELGATAYAWDALGEPAAAPA
jgi:hypothetical protein